METKVGITYSKWRQQSVEVKAGELKEVYFDNTKPNMFFLSNFNDVDLYGGLSRTPTAKKHEFVFKAHKQKPFGGPHGKHVLYLLNLSTEDAEVDVYSTEMPFDLNVLQDFSVDNVTITTDDPVSFELAGVKEGLKVPIYSDKLNAMEGDLESVVNHLTLLLNNEQSAKGVGLVQLLNRLRNIDNGLVKLISGEAAADVTNLHDVVKAIVDKEVLLNAENVTVNTVWTRDNVSALLTDVKEILSNLNGSNGNPLYSNNAAMFNVTNTTGEALPLHIDWLYVNGGDMDIKLDGNVLFTIKDGEKFDNFDFILPVGGDFSITGANGKIRMKYYMTPSNGNKVYFSIGNEDFNVANGTTWRQFAESKGYYPDQTMIWNNNSFDLALKDANNTYVQPDSIITAGAYKWDA